MTIVPRSRYTAATMIRNRINSPLYCAVCAAVLYAAFVALRLGAGGADVWSFALVGSDFAIQREMHPAVRIQPGQGYDGQFFFGLAHEPVTRDSVAGGVRLDHPAYRQQRILYPLLVWLLSQGSYHLMPWMLVAVNWAALIAVAYIGGALAAHCGRHALWGLLPACYPGYLLSFSRDLAEPLTAAMLLWGLWRLAAHKRWAALPLCLAVLCRETAVLLPAALVAAALWKGRRDWLLAGVLPLCVLALWQAVVWGLWGQPSWQAGGGNLGLPFVGLGQGLMRSLPQLGLLSQGLYVAQLGCLVVYGGAGAAGIRGWNAREAAPYLPIAWTCAFALMLLLSHAVWVEGWAFMRAAGELALFSAILAFSGALQWPRVTAAALGGCLWLVLALKIALLD